MIQYKSIWNIKDVYMRKRRIYEKYVKGNRILREKELIQSIRENPFHSKVYFEYAQYLKKKNINQAYLCFENGMGYCTDSGELENVKQEIKNCRKSPFFEVQNCSIIILTFQNIEYTKKCIESLRENGLQDSYELIIIDNGSVDGTREWLQEQNDINVFLSEENLGFPKGCNKGASIAKPGNDYLFLNNDTLVPPNALFWLRMGLYEDKKIGAAGSVSNYILKNQTTMPKEIPVKECMNYAKKFPLEDEILYENRLFLIGYAILIKGACFNQVEGFDEIYSPGNFEDQDICLKMIEKGFKNILCYNSFIYHYSGKSFQVGSEAYNQVIARNLEIFCNRWTYDFGKIRDDLLDFIKEEPEKEFVVLDVGCGAGCTLMRLQGLYQNIKLLGFEKEKSLVELVKGVAPVIWCDVEEIKAYSLEKESVDYLILGNVLEQLKNPELFLKRIKPFLKKNCKIIADIYNIRNTRIMEGLLQGKFEYSHKGILNYANIHIYTLNNMIDLFYQSGYNIKDITYDDKSNFYTQTENSHINKISNFLKEENPELWSAESFCILAELQSD